MKVVAEVHLSGLELEWLFQRPFRLFSSSGNEATKQRNDEVQKAFEFVEL